MKRREMVVIIVVNAILSALISTLVAALVVITAPRLIGSAFPDATSSDLGSAVSQQA